MIMLMKRLFTFCTFFLFISCLQAQQSLDSVAIRFASTINKNDLSKHLHVLASDEYLGRETGKEGQKMAAKYIAAYFQLLGLKPIGDEQTYFQVFGVIERSPGGTIRVNGVNGQFIRNFYYFPGTPDSVYKLKSVVYAGYGIDDKKYSDYKNIDVKGKVVLISSGEPHDKKGKSFVTGKKGDSDWANDIRKKISAARDNGAAMVLFIQDNYIQNVEYLRHYIEKPSMHLATEEVESTRKRLPAFFLNPEIAYKIISKAEIEGIEQKISKTKKPVSKVIETDMTIDITSNEKNLTAENVLGFIEGTDLKDEIVLITAHYDHIGVDGEEVYNGADDDGSGTVAIMEIAEAFQKAAEAGFRPRRSILIMPVSGEEKGLLGSYYYSEHPVFPLKNTVVDLNIDMIGRLDSAHLNHADYVYVIGSDILSKDLHNISETANTLYSHLDLDYRYNNLTDPNRFYYRSDHYNFARKDIPVIFYFNGVHADYHKPTDEVDKINFDKMEKIARLVFFTAWEIANRDERPALDKKP